MRKLLIVSTIVLAAGVLFAGTAAAGDFSGGEIEYHSTVFSHELHAEQFGFSCETCHDGLFAMEAGAMTRQADFSMESMYEGDSCGSCHDGSMAFDAGGNCNGCHETGGDIYYDKPVKSVLFSHEDHVEEMGFDCATCHSGSFTMDAKAAQQNDDFTMNALYEGKYCGSCHDGSMAFASDTRCTTCHVGVKGYERAHGEPAEAKTAHAAH